MPPPHRLQPHVPQAAAPSVRPSRCAAEMGWSTYPGSVFGGWQHASTPQKRPATAPCIPRRRGPCQQVLPCSLVITPTLSASSYVFPCYHPYHAVPLLRCAADDHPSPCHARAVPLVIAPLPSWHWSVLRCCGDMVRLRLSRSARAMSKRQRTGTEFVINQ